MSTIHTTRAGRLITSLMLAIFALAPWLPLCAPSVSQATLPPVMNFAKVTVSTGYSSAATSIVLLSGHGAKLPSADFPFPLVWWNATDYASPEDDPFVEVVSVTARTGDTVTVVRAQEGTSASNHNTGGKTYRMVLTLTKSMWDQIRTDIAVAAGASSMITSGSGSPEGVVTATLGALYLRTTDSGIGNTLYTKETNTGNTGWAVIATVASVATTLAAPGPIGTTTPNIGAFTAMAWTRHRGTPVTPTYGASVAIDLSLGDWFIVTATNSTSFTIINPSGVTPTAGDEIEITVVNSSGGAITMTTPFDTLYKLASFTKPANGFNRTVRFKYTGSVWREVSCSPEVPN